MSRLYGLGDMPRYWISFYLGSDFTTLSDYIKYNAKVPLQTLSALQAKTLRKRKSVEKVHDTIWNSMYTSFSNYSAAQRSCRQDALYFWSMRFLQERTVLFQIKRYLAVLEIELEFLDLRIKGLQNVDEEKLRLLDIYLRRFLREPPNVPLELTRLDLVDEVQNYRQIKEEEEVIRLMRDLKIPREISPEGEENSSLKCSSSAGRETRNPDPLGEKKEDISEIHLAWERTIQNVETIVRQRQQ